MRKKGALGNNYNMKHQKLNDNKFKFFADRLMIMSIAICCMFTVIAYQFYKIQVIEHDAYAQELRATVEKEVEIPAIRGSIYDRYGKPLANNKAVYVLKYDPQVSLKSGERDKILLKVANLLEETGDTYIDNVPISMTVPFAFTEDTQAVRRFITNYVPYNDNDHKEVIYGYSAAELIAYLRSEEVFDIDPSFSDEEARKIIAMRLEIRQTTYQKYKTVTIAQDVSMKALAAIEENQMEYASITPEVESQRSYPYGKAFGNVLGYTRMITESQYATLAERGYDKDDIVGQVGIESEMESELRGEKGSKLIEVDNVGRTVFTLETEEATAGNDVYLTIDAELQMATYEALEKRLSEGIIARLKGTAKTTPLTGREILVSMAKNNQLDFKEMSAAPEEEMQRQLYDKVRQSYEAEMKHLEEVESGYPEEEKTDLEIKEHFANMLDSEEVLITDRELLLAFAEQGSLNLSSEQVQNIKLGNYNLTSLLISQLESGGLTPDQTDIMPCSGSAVVVDPNTGQTLALVSYPSYDNNEFIQNFNSLYTKLHDGVDTRNIEINRALKTAKAPGSTFKMITGIAGLEEGVVTEDTLIYDTGEFTKAGRPYPKCWIFTNTGSGHGNVNLKSALEVSCNYYFYEVAYRLGLKYGAPYGAINTLTKYVEMFGLSEKTNIELEETAPNVSNPTTVVDTQIISALKRLRDLKEPNKSELLELIMENFELGAATYTEGVDEQIDDLTSATISKAVGTDLAIAISDELENIFNKMIEDYGEELADTLSTYGDQMTETVINGDNSLSLKYRTKRVLAEALNQLVQPGTRKTIAKTVEKMSSELVQQTFLQAYEIALKQNENNAAMSQVCEELRNRIQAIQDGSFDYGAIMTDKIINGMISVYLNNRFKNVEMEWTVADNVRTAIGQGDNGFTPVQMARYTAGLANGKTVYDLTIINGIKDHKDTGKYISKQPTVYQDLHLKQTTIDAIHEGMRLVAEGNSGTARTYFSDFPIEVAAKTGTAQESSWENSWFVGFAPYDTADIAVATSMYGADGLGGYNTQVARDIFEQYFKLNKEDQKVSLDSQFVE
ncbi:MAG: hypothetical protein E7231_15300 [Cellulosilyticum sp.]|nr:hypothetical protein [Cellulosilyticum sp.]